MKRELDLGKIPPGERVYRVCSNPGPGVCLLSPDVRNTEGRQLPSADIELAMLAVAVWMVAQADGFSVRSGQIMVQPDLLIVPVGLTACEGFIQRVEVLLNTMTDELERSARDQHAA